MREFHDDSVGTPLSTLRDAGRRGDGGHPGAAEPPTGPPGSGTEGGARFVPYFPYLGIPHDGFDTPRA